MENELLYLLYFKDARASSCPCLLEDAAWGSCWPSCHKKNRPTKPAPNQTKPEPRHARPKTPVTPPMYSFSPRAGRSSQTSPRSRPTAIHRQSFSFRHPRTRHRTARRLLGVVSDFPTELHDSSIRARRARAHKSHATEWRDRCVAVFRAVVAGRYLVCRFN